MATLKVIAAMPDLSVTQVSRVLNNRFDANEDTRERVNSMARFVRYQPNMSARNRVFKATVRNPRRFPSRQPETR